MAVLPRGPVLTLSRFDDALATGLHSCDLGSLTFIDAYGLVGTACAIQAAQQTEPELRISGPSSTGMSDHLAAMGMQSFLLGIGHASVLPGLPPSGAEDVVVPLPTRRAPVPLRSCRIWLWEQLHPHVDAQVLTAVSEGVWELVANALEHSGADALLMAQIYRRRRGGRPPDHDDRVQVVIGDTGRGIRSSFVATAVRIPRTDLEAINFALEYLVTSVPNDRGRGQGLSTTMELVTEMQGKMVVRSGNAKVTIHPGERSEATVPALPGVIVALSLPLYPGG